MAQDLGDRLLPAFDTPTSIPIGTVNLMHGVPPGETTITSLAGAGTYLLEFGMLSKLTNDSKYEDAAKGAMRALWALRSRVGLVGNHIDVWTGKWK
jgi:mannosidase alpha-like ER degradation enhancer 2